MLSLLASVALLTTSVPAQPVSHSCDLCASRPAFVEDILLSIQEKEVDPQETKKREEAEKRLKDDIQRDIELGKQAEEEIDKQLKASTDLDATARLQAIGAEIAEIANQDAVSVLWGDQRHSTFEYKFKLVQGEDVNAFSLPGGTIYFFEGLLKFAESDDELAGVVAHEISHAAFRHVATLQREQAKFSLATLPLVIAAAMSGGNRDAVNALMAAQLVGAGVSSGWSVQAETSADYGGIQYLRKSRYNPVGVLTFMERLGYRERLSPQIDWGIYRTHPPTNERAQFIIRSLNEFGVPIKRSSTTTSLSARSIPGSDGSYTIWFGDHSIATYRGEGAKDRAARSVIRLNSFLDAVPQMFQMTTDGDAILGNGRALIELGSSDLAEGESVEKERDDALVSLRRVISELNMRLWRI